MSGLIPHLIVALLAVIVVHLIHFNWKYSLSIFIGALLPDVLKFGFTVIEQLTWSVFYVKKDALYYAISDITSSFTNWMALGFFVFAVSTFLFHFHVIREKKMEDYDLIYVFLLIGILIHLLMDVLFIEHGPWI